VPRSGYIADLRRLVGNRLLTVPSVTAAVFNEHDQLLMLQHQDGGLWAPPGGTIEPGESPADAVVREVWEETSLLVYPVSIVGVFGGEGFEIHYDNGDVTTYVMTVFECRVESPGDIDLDYEEVRSHDFFAQHEALRRTAAPWVPAVVPELFRWRQDPGLARFSRPSWRPL
jgi:8-oxo-dGTP pyrophosphatase MutT (NUDIX family)